MAIRTDASTEIGTGHVMRCLTLAETLRKRGWEVSFVSRALSGHMLDRISSAGHRLFPLQAPKSGVTLPDEPAHANWAGVRWEDDAQETSDSLKGAPPDWLLLDHYAFDGRWTRRTKPEGARIMVWDDLADRPHDADLLLDQNLGRRPQDYDGLVGSNCRRLIGPQHAVLRPDFGAIRQHSLNARRHRALRHVLIAMGGVDLPNVTSRVLSALATGPKPDGLRVTVVLGSGAPALEDVRCKAKELSVPVSVKTDVPDMARLIADADLAIGGAGGTAWERCCLGLPTLLVVLAENQEQAARALASTGAALLLGRADQPNLESRISQTLGVLAQREALATLSESAARVTDGRGATRVADVIESYHV